MNSFVSKNQTLPCNQTIHYPNNHKTSSIMEQINEFLEIKDNCLIECGQAAEGTVVVPDGIKAIGYQAFYNCKKVIEIILPETITIIGDAAFSECTSLEKINIPKSVKIVGKQLFGYCYKLKEVQFPSTTIRVPSHYWWETETWGRERRVLTGNESVDSVPEGSGPIGCDSLKIIKIPEGLDSIDSFAYQGNSEIMGVIILEGIKRIGDGAFKNCKNLEFIRLPNTLTEIGDYAFENCECLYDLHIPNNVERIGNGAFRNCEDMMWIDLPRDIKMIGDSAFENTRIENISLNKGLVSIGSSAFAKTFLSSIDIPNTVKKIGANAFNTIKESIIVPPGIEEIGKNAFVLTKKIRINTPKNQIKCRYSDLCNAAPNGTLVFAEPQPCHDYSDIPGYIRVTQIHDSFPSSNVDWYYDITDINTNYIVNLKPVSIKRDHIVEGTTITLAIRYDHVIVIDVYESPKLVAEKIRKSLERLTQEAGGIAGLFHQLEELCKPQLE